MFRDELEIDVQFSIRIVTKMGEGSYDRRKRKVYLKRRWLKIFREYLYCRFSQFFPRFVQVLRSGRNERNADSLTVPIFRFQSNFESAMLDKGLRSLFLLFLSPVGKKILFRSP